MTRQEYKEKIVNRLIFINKIKDADTIDNLKNAEFEAIMLYYIQSQSLPVTAMDYNSQFVWIKKYASYAIEQEINASKRLRNTEETYKKFLRETGAKTTSDFNQEQLEKYKLMVDMIDSSKRIVDLYQQRIMIINEKLEYICDYYDRINLPFHDFVGLCGLNERNAKLSIRHYKDKENRYYKFLFLGIEDDHGHEKDGWKSNRFGMPLQDLVFENFLFTLDRNKEAKEKVHNYLMHDMGFASAAMTLTEDEEGNMVAEKYYPPLKAMK